MAHYLQLPLQPERPLNLDNLPEPPMRLSSIVSLVVVTASFALGGCAYGSSADVENGTQEPAIAAEPTIAQPNVTHSAHGAVPDQGRIADVVIGKDRVSLQIGKPAAIPVDGVPDISGKLGLAVPAGQISGVAVHGRVDVPSLKPQGGFDPSMTSVIPPIKVTPVDLDGLAGIPELAEPGMGIDPAMPVVASPDGRKRPD